MIRQPILLLAISIFLMNCKAPAPSEVGMDSDLVYNETTSIQGDSQIQNKLITVPFLAEGNKLVGAAALVPEGWQGNAWMDFSLYNTTIQPKPKITLQKGNSTFKAELIEWFSYNPQTAEFHKAMNTRESKFVRMPGDLMQDVRELVLAPNYPNYNAVNQQRVEDLFLHPVPNTEVYRVDLENPQNPEFVTTVYAVRQVETNYGITIWNMNYSAVEGPKAQHRQLLDVAKVFANSFQMNPYYLQYIGELNQKGLAHQRAMFNRQQKAIMGAYEHTSNVLSQLRESRNTEQTNHSQQFSDVMLDQTTYVTLDGGEISLPTTDEYTFSNGIGDFVSTNNPLFDPNQTSNMHNWMLLQEKFQ